MATKLGLRTRSAPPAQVAAVALLAGGVGLGVASFLPAYLDGASLASQADLATAHALPLAGFALAAVLAVLARPRAVDRRQPLGLPGVLGLGVAAVDLGLLVTDLAQAATAGSTAGGGLVLSVLEWALCAAGSLLALHPSLLRGERRASGGEARVDVLRFVLFAVVGLAVAGLFAPAWDRYVVHLTAIGRVSTVTAGNAFSEPGAMVAGSVLVMAGIVVVAMLAGLLRHGKVAATLVAGGLVVLVGQIASALVQWRIPVSPSQLGLSPARASALGVHISAGFTAAFYLFCAFVALLGLLGLVRARVGALPRPARARRGGGGAPAGGPPPWWGAGGVPGPFATPGGLPTAGAGGAPPPWAGPPGAFGPGGPFPATGPFPETGPSPRTVPFPPTGPPPTGPLPTTEAFSSAGPVSSAGAELPASGEAGPPGRTRAPGGPVAGPGPATPSADGGERPRPRRRFTPHY